MDWHSAVVQVSHACPVTLLSCAVCVRGSPTTTEHPSYINLNCRNYHGQEVLWIQTGFMPAGKYERFLFSPFYYNVELATTNQCFQPKYWKNKYPQSILVTFQWVQTTRMFNLKHTTTSCRHNELHLFSNSLETEISITNINKILSFLDDWYGVKCFVNAGVLLTGTKGRTVAKTIKLRFYKGFPPSTE